MIKSQIWIMQILNRNNFFSIPAFSEKRERRDPRRMSPLPRLQRPTPKCGRLAWKLRKPPNRSTGKSHLIMSTHWMNNYVHYWKRFWCWMRKMLVQWSYMKLAILLHWHLSGAYCKWTNKYRIKVLFILLFSIVGKFLKSHL